MFCRFAQVLGRASGGCRVAAGSWWLPRCSGVVVVAALQRGRGGCSVAAGSWWLQRCSGVVVVAPLQRGRGGCTVAAGSSEEARDVWPRRFGQLTFDIRRVCCWSFGLLLAGIELTVRAESPATFIPPLVCQLFIATSMVLGLGSVV
jgi:hypothetical protein